MLIFYSIILLAIDGKVSALCTGPWKLNAICASASRRSSVVARIMHGATQPTKLYIPTIMPNVICTINDQFAHATHSRSAIYTHIPQHPYTTDIIYQINFRISGDKRSLHQRGR